MRSKDGFGTARKGVVLLAFILLGVLTVGGAAFAQTPAFWTSGYTANYRRNAASSQATFTNLRVFMATTASSAFPSTANYYTPITQVSYFPTFVVPAGNINDWFQIPIQNPFYYLPSQGLIVRICQDAYVNGIQIMAYSGTAPPYGRIWSSSCPV